MGKFADKCSFGGGISSISGGKGCFCLLATICGETDGMRKLKTELLAFLISLAIGIILYDVYILTLFPLYAPNLVISSFSRAHTINYPSYHSQQTDYNLYCDTDAETCKSKSTIPLQGTGNTFSANHNTERCASGFKPSTSPTGDKCMQMAALGCSFTTSDHYSRDGNIQCPKNSDFSAGDNADDPGTCTRSDNSVVDIHGEGDLCGYEVNGRKQACGHNLVCSSDSKCIKAHDVGGECGTDASRCMAGLICVNFACIEPFTLPDGAPCETNDGNAQFFDGCASGYCNSAGVCAPTPTGAKCWRNIDCAGAANSACVDATNENPGTCLAVYNVAKGDWLRCVREECGRQPTEGDSEDNWTQDQLQDCMTTGITRKNGEDTSFTEHCMKSYARYMCSKYCTRAPEERNPLLDGDEFFVHRGEVPFKFDCQEQTVTALSQSDCNLSNLFSNCQAIRQYKSAAPRAQSFNLIQAVVMTVALSAAMMLFAF